MNPPHPSSDEIFRRLLDESSAVLCDPVGAGIEIPDDELHREILLPLLPAMLGDGAIRKHWHDQAATGFLARLTRHLQGDEAAPQWQPADFEIHVTASYSAGPDAKALADTLLSEDSLRDMSAALMNQVLAAVWPKLELPAVEVVPAEVEAAAAPLTEPVGESVAEPVPELFAESDAAPASEPDGEPAAQPVLESVSEPASAAVAQPVAGAVAESLVEPTAEDFGEPIGELVVEVIAEPLPDAVAQNLAEPVAEPVAELTTETLPSPEPAVEAAPAPELLGTTEELTPVSLDAARTPLGLPHLPAKEGAASSESEG